MLLSYPLAFLPLEYNMCMWTRCLVKRVSDFLKPTLSSKMSDDDDSFDLSHLGFVDVDPGAFEEEQLAAAIAASLANVDTPKVESASKPEPADIISLASSSSERSDSETPISHPSGQNPSSGAAMAPSASRSNNDAVADPSPSQSVFRSERAALEQARLERQKRRREDEEAILGPPSQTPGAGPSNLPAQQHKRERDDGLGVYRATKIMCVPTGSFLTMIHRDWIATFITHADISCCF